MKRYFRKYGHNLLIVDNMLYYTRSIIDKSYLLLAWLTIVKSRLLFIMYLLLNGTSLNKQLWSEQIPNTYQPFATLSYQNNLHTD